MSFCAHIFALFVQFENYKAATIVIMWLLLSLDGVVCPCSPRLSFSYFCCCQYGAIYDKLSNNGAQSSFVIRNTHRSSTHTHKPPYVASILGKTLWLRVLAHAVLRVDPVTG